MAPRDLPALVIWGEHDAYLPPRTPSASATPSPPPTSTCSPASGHWPFADAPETVERLLVEFLEGAARSTAGRTG